MYLCVAIVGAVGWLLVNYDDGVSQDYNYEDFYSEQSSQTEGVDRELQRVLNKIAGTYEMCEPRGIEGIHVVYTVKINSDGTGVIVYDTGDREYFTGAYLKDNSTIVFTSDYGGTLFTITGNGIEDPACRKYYNEVGALRYYMRKL